MSVRMPVSLSQMYNEGEKLQRCPEADRWNQDNRTSCSPQMYQWPETTHPGDFCTPIPAEGREAPHGVTATDDQRQWTVDPARVEANHPGKSWEHGPRHPGPPDTQPNWATKGAGQRPRLEHSATFPRKQNKMLLYEDFMADFVCLHFCTRRCRKDGKLVGTKVKPCFQGLLTAGPTGRMLSITTFTVPLDQTKSFMFKNFYFTQTLNIKNIIVMATL